jgi:hypothetical protein
MYEKMLKVPDVKTVVQGHITQEQGANPGFLKEGDLRVYFLYDALGRLLAYRIYIQQGENWTLATNPRFDPANHVISN